VFLTLPLSWGSSDNTVQFKNPETGVELVQQRLLYNFYTINLLKIKYTNTLDLINLITFRGE
jgi:hypothetical protein